MAGRYATIEEDIAIGEGAPLSVSVTANDAARRYEITVDGAAAGFTQYRLHGDVATFLHTEIDRAFEGHGLASQLIRQALDDVRTRGWRVVAICPFVKAFIEKHADYQDLLAS